MKKAIIILFLICICLYSCKEEDETFIEDTQIKNTNLEYEIFDEPIENFQYGLVTTDSVYCLFEDNDSIDGYVCYIGQKKGKDLPLVVKIDTLGVIRSLFAKTHFMILDIRKKRLTL